MSKLFYRNVLAVFVLAFPIAALADVTGTPTLPANTTFSLDTGPCVTSGGDITWSGTTITPQGSAVGIDVTPLAGLSGASGYSTVTSALITSLATSFGSLLSNSPITPNINDLLIVKTNG